jgi:hypothetical protein
MKRVLFVLLLAAAAVAVAVPVQATPSEGGRPRRHTCPTGQLVYPAAFIQVSGPQDAEVAAVEYAGIAEGERSWYDAAQNRFYTEHIRSSVAHEAVGTCNDYDYWAYRAHVWCTSEYGPLSYTTPCDMVVDRAELRTKPCREFTQCTSEAPWGGGDWVRHNDDDYTFQGSWHLFGTPGTASASLLTFSDDFRVKFLSSTGDHVTNNRTACSAWVWEGNTDYQADSWCTGLFG